MTTMRTIDPWVRKPLEDFAYEMERVLRSHDDEKPGWEEMHPDEHLDKITEEYEELRRAFAPYAGDPWPLGRAAGRAARRDNLMHECVDLANVCMMLWDRLKEGRDL